MREEYDFSKDNAKKNPYIEDEKIAVMCHLTKLYLKATKENKTELATRLTRAMIAFDYDDMREPADWKKMCETYLGKE